MKQAHNLALLETRDQIQEDLLSLLDPYPEETKNLACQIVVDNFKILIDKLNNKS